MSKARELTDYLNDIKTAIALAKKANQIFIRISSRKRKMYTALRELYDKEIISGNFLSPSLL
jgi:hypothetical protein